MSSELRTLSPLSRAEPGAGTCPLSEDPHLVEAHERKIQLLLPFWLRGQEILKIHQEAGQGTRTVEKWSGWQLLQQADEGHRHSGILTIEEVTTFDKDTELSTAASYSDSACTEPENVLWDESDVRMWCVCVYERFHSVFMTVRQMPKLCFNSADLG